MAFSVVPCLVLACALAVTVAGRAWPCESDLDCNYDECCVLSFTGQGKECRELSEDVGAPCGGDYFCNECSKNLVCTLLEIPVPETNDTMEPVEQTPPQDEGILTKTYNLMFNTTEEPAPEQQSCGNFRPANATCQPAPPQVLEEPQPVNEYEEL